MTESNSLVVHGAQHLQPTKLSNIQYLIYGNLVRQRSYFDQAAVDKLVERFSPVNRHKVSLSDPQKSDSRQSRSTSRSSKRSSLQTSASVSLERSVSPQPPSQMILRSRKSLSKYPDNFSQDQSRHSDDLEHDVQDRSTLSDNESDLFGSPMEESQDKQDRSRISAEESRNQTDQIGSLMEVSSDKQDRSRISVEESRNQTDQFGSLMEVSSDKQDRSRIFDESDLFGSLTGEKQDRPIMSVKESHNQSDQFGSLMEVSVDKQDRSRIFDESDLFGSLTEETSDKQDRPGISVKESHIQTDQVGSLTEISPDKQDRTGSIQQISHIQLNQSRITDPSESSAVFNVSVQHTPGFCRSSPPDKLPSIQQDPTENKSSDKLDKSGFADRISHIQENRSEISNDLQKSQFDPQQSLTNDPNPSYEKQHMPDPQEQSRLNQSRTAEKISQSPEGRTINQQDRLAQMDFHRGLLHGSQIDPFKYVQYPPTQSQCSAILNNRPQQLEYTPNQSQCSVIDNNTSQSVQSTPASQRCSIIGSYPSNQMHCTPGQPHYSVIDINTSQSMHCTPGQPHYSVIDFFRSQYIQSTPASQQCTIIGSYPTNQMHWTPVQTHCSAIDINTSQSMQCTPGQPHYSVIDFLRSQYIGSYPPNQMPYTPGQPTNLTQYSYQLSQQMPCVPCPQKLAPNRTTSSISTWSQSSSSSESNNSSRAASLHSKSTASQFSDETDSDVDIDREWGGPSNSFFQSNRPTLVPVVQDSFRRGKQAQVSSSGVSSISSSQDIAEPDWPRRPLHSFHSQSTPSQFSESGSEQASSGTRRYPFLKKRACTIDDLIERKRQKTSQSSS